MPTLYIDFFFFGTKNCFSELSCIAGSEVVEAKIMLSVQHDVCEAPTGCVQVLMSSGQLDVSLKLRAELDVRGQHPNCHVQVQEGEDSSSGG